jgi:hypothetical protein
MTEPRPEVERFLRQTNIIVWFVVIASMVVAGSIGFGIAMATHGKPQWDSGIHIAVGLIFLAQGLVRQFRLGAYGPKFPSQNRVQESVINSGMVLLGVSQITNDSVVGTPAAIVALILVLAAAFRRPRRYF